MTALRHTTSDGYELIGEVLGSGPAVVLVHGGGGSHRSMLPLATHLAAACTVVVPSLRGYGGTVCADPACHTWERYARDLVEVLDSLGIERAAVGGASVGAGVATRFALDLPERTRGLVLMSVHHGGEDRPTPEQVAQQIEVADRILAEGIEPVIAPMLAGLPPGQAATIRGEMSHQDRASAAAWLRGLAAIEPFERMADLAAIGVPALVVAGGDDLHPRALSERYVEVLPDATLADVAWWDDTTSQQARAEQLAAAIMPFLTALGG